MPRARSWRAAWRPSPNSIRTPGWVEQDAEALWQSVQRAAGECLRDHDPRLIAGVGIANQRESLVLWDRRTGAALAPVVSWQDQRGSAICDRLRDGATEAAGTRAERPAARPDVLRRQGHSAAGRARSATANAPAPVRSVLGTVDAWLVQKFAGSAAEPVIEAGNASRTQLLDVRGGSWDPALLELFGVPAAALPRVVGSTGPFPAVRGLPPLPDGVPLCAVMGDSHAALFAHGARGPGPVKATFGTGSSVMGLIARPQDLDPGLCLTIGWTMGRPAYAAEGNIRATGAALRWLATLFGRTPAALAELGAQAASGGVVLVPGFTGLGAPYWDGEAVGLLANLRLDTDLAALARAALDAIVQQIADVAEAMARSGSPVAELFADGGPSRNDALMQMQADLLGCPVVRAHDAELSALGVAHMAGLAAGVWSEAALAALKRPRDAFLPAMGADERAARRAEWRRAVARARSG